MLLADLAVTARLVSWDTPISEIEAIFLLDGRLEAVLVGERDDATILGLVERGQFFTFLSGRLGYGRALYGSRQLHVYPAPAVLIVPPTTTVDEAARLAIARGANRWGDAIAIEFTDGYSIVAGATVFKHVTDELTDQLEVDVLTGVTNRRGLLRRLDEHITKAHASLVLLMLDLDGFKLVNDALGHHVGDELLITVAQRIRRASPPGAVVARMGGDEFAVVTELTDRTTPEEIGMALVQRVGLPQRIAGTDVSIGGSVGVAQWSSGASASEMLQRADVALYRAKAAGKNCAFVFDDLIRRDVQRQLVISQELRAAIDTNDLRLHYQPIVDLDNGAVVAVEALARWTSPTFGHVSPTEFIGVAERIGLITTLGRTLLSTALNTLATSTGTARRVNLHVNVSRRELHQPDLVRAVSEALQHTGVDPTQLVLEVTETAVALDSRRLISTLHQIADLGVRIALDDFGAGATALSNLWQFPLDIVKLDISLISKLLMPGPVGGTETARMKAIIELCHAHDLVVTAEGVENPEQATVLRQLGCDYAQGWLYGRPNPDLSAAWDTTNMATPTSQHH